MLRSCVLLVRGQVHQRDQRVGKQICFADGSQSSIYRETTIDRPPPMAPCALVVCFRLRWLRREWSHRAFRVESILNTLLFVGFPGFVSKLWLRHDGNDLYRGVYEWDDAQLAEAYARALWWVLALVSEPNSIQYVVVPTVRRDDLVDHIDRADIGMPIERNVWWLPVSTEATAMASHLSIGRSGAPARS